MKCCSTMWFYLRFYEGSEVLHSISEVPQKCVLYKWKERSISQARASVMVYNNDLKKWEYAGGSQGLSQIHVYHNPNQETYRIVGRKLNDKEVVINCNIAKNLKYNKATATFHQWRDQRQVYGLNFQTADDANTFSTSVLGAVDKLLNPPEPSPAQPPPQSNGYDGHPGSQYQKFQEDPYRKPQVSLEPQRPPQATVTVTRTEPPKPAAVPPAPAPPPVLSAVPPATPAPPPVPSSGPPAPPAGGPPAPPGGGPPPPPPPPPVGGGPPAPPPPPVGGPSGGGAGGPGGAGGLAGALKGVQLKKRSDSTEDRRPPPAAANPMDDMMSALNKKLQSRKKMVESSEPGEAPKVSPPSTIKSSFPPPSKTNTLQKQSTLNKPTNFVTPNNKNNSGTLSRNNSTSSSVSSEELKSLKEEILKTVRQEIEAAKKDIIDAVREEIQKLST